jgi:SAM-dependent methyltransferase
VGYLANVFTASNRRNKERILELSPPVEGARLLDLGCADGGFTLELAQRIGATELHGIEFVEPLAELAAGRGIDVRRADLNGVFPYEADTFDVVHSNQVIEHLVKTDSFLKEIGRVLKPSGYALVSTNNLASWHNIFSLVLGMQPTPCHVSDEVVLGNRFNPYRGREHSKGATHLRVFSYSALAELLELHGLAVDVLVTSGYYPFPPRIADRLCRVDRRHGAFLIARASKRAQPRS